MGGEASNKMDQYLDLVRRVLTEGTFKDNRTGVHTIASFSESYTIDLKEGFPLLTTKAMDGPIWDSLRHELIWYLSGEEHIRTLREETGIWDAWADEDGQLDTAYGRFWRRFPLPAAELPGESWPDDDHRWVNDDEETFDQVRYVLDRLEEDPHSRRMVVSAWHPANAAVSTLPPCHYTYVVSVHDGKVNLHLTQRSGDVALGVPFNIAGYSVLATIFAQRAGLEVGEFGHTIVDAHIYCGQDERGAWYAKHLPALQERMRSVEALEDYLEIKAWLEAEAPQGDGFDHVPNLLEQLTRTPRERPSLHVEDVPVDELTVEDIQLSEYRSADRLRFKVAE